MHKTIQSFWLAAAFSVMTASLATADSSFSEVSTEHYSVPPGIAIEVENVNGNIDITSWGEPTVEVHTVKKSRKGQPELDRLRVDVQVDDIMTIKTVKDDFMDYDDEDETFFDRLFGSGSGSGWPKVSVDFTIKVPINSTLTLAKTTNGNVEIDGTHGDTTAKSTNGTVRIYGTDGTITARTTNGNIKIVDAQVLSARSTNGSIDIRDGSLNGDARTTNGGIDAEIANPLAGDVEIGTVNGSIDIYLNPDMDAALDLKSSNGKITVEGFKLMVTSISKKNVVGELGNGGFTLKARTVNGSIDLHRK